MAELGVGVVGTGWVSGEHIRAYVNNPHTEVRALCGRTEEGARRKMEECGISCDIYTDYDRMLERKDIDIISICTPNHLHAEETIKAAEAKKHILMEKPIALNMEELNSIRYAVERAGVKTITSFVLRWNPLFKIIKSLIDSGEIGDIFYGEVDYFHGIGPWYKQYAWNVKREIGGSSLLSAGCHAVDGLLWFMGDEVVEVSAYSTRGEAEEFKDYEYDPTQVTILRFKSGAVGKVASSLECKMPYVFNIFLLGENGTIRNNQLYSDRLSGQTGWATIPTILPDSGDVTHHPFQGEVDHFVDCILNDKDTLVDMKNAFRTHEVIFAADRSAAEGRPVRM